MRYDFEFKEKTAGEMGINIETRPQIPGRKRTIEYIEVSGKEELLTIEGTAFENITISVECSFKEEPDKWHEKRRNVTNWLSGAGRLIFSDSADTFFKVKAASINYFERIIRKYARFQVQFEASPFEYVLEGQEEKEIEEAQFNPYYQCCPTYIVQGKGSCTLSVNGKAMAVLVNSKTYINTEFMLAYEESGALQNTSVKGNYMDLRLEHGENKISISRGFSLKIIPNWRW